MKLNPIRPAVCSLVALFLLFLPAAGFCGVPPLLNFQGRIVIGGTSFNGAGQFQFALVDGTGVNTFWSNDGTSTGGSEPSASITLTLTNGLYSVLLGDTTVSGMTQPLAAGVFTNSDVRLRVWFNDGTHGFEKLAPDQRMAAAGYALVADTANNFTGSISGAQLPANTATTNFVISQGYVTATVTNGLASISYVSAATNGLVTSAVTNGLATTNFVFALNYVTASVTNGMATTNFILSQNYVTASVTNGLATVAYVNSSTNGFVTAAITNSLATTNYVRAATNGFVTVAITNGLATTNYVNGITNGLATTGFVLSQNYVTATVTNGLASISYVNTATNGLVTATVTNGLATVSYVNSGTNFVGTNALAQLNSASNALAGQIVVATASALSKPVAIWIGVSGGTLGASSTHYAAPNNNTSMSATTDTTGITRAPVPESVTLTNLYVAISANLGNNHTATLTIMTNGVATPIAVTISGSSQTNGNDTTDSVTVPAGTLIGVRVVTGAGAGSRDWSWSFEGW